MADMYFPSTMQTASSQRRPLWVAISAHPLSWVVIACSCLALDFLAGPSIHLAATSVLSVALAAWHRGLRWALPFALGQPAVRFAFIFFWDVPSSLPVSAVNLLIRAVVLCGFACLVAHTAQQKRLVADLERLLCVCAWCKRIRDEKDAWQPLEKYLSNRGESAVTHGICPDCARKQLPEPTET
jgi:hypothetical protein